MAGANLNYKPNQRIVTAVLRLLGFTASGKLTGRSGKISFKDGAPVNNEPTDDPIAVGDICYDYTNGDAYIALTRTAADAHTWAKITP